jgi:glycosyltransferase involved in cell wall biosynthesis
LLPPRDIGAWTQALTHLLTDAFARADLRARGLARAQAFTWEAAAQKTLAVYRRVLSQ